MGSTLCDTCSAIQFNDEPLAPHVVERDDVPPFLSRDDLRGPYSFGERFQPDYSICDFLPTLPCLEQSADRGCDFCSLLRGEIIRADFDYRGFICIQLAYHWDDQFHFPGLGLAALVAELKWLPGIPSIPPSSRPPDVLRDCIIFTLETDDGELF